MTNDNYRLALDEILLNKLNPNGVSLVQNRIDIVSKFKQLEIDDKMWKFLLDKLKSDGYLKQLTIEYSEITVEGIFFIKDGGYTKEYQRIEDKKSFEKELRNSTIETETLSRKSLTVSKWVSILTLTAIITQTIMATRPVEIQSKQDLTNLMPITEELSELRLSLGRLETYSTIDSLKSEVQRLSMRLDSTYNKN